MGALFMKAGFKKLGIDGKGYKNFVKTASLSKWVKMMPFWLKSLADPQMMGVFGFSFFDQNRDKVQASIIDGVELNFDNIASYDYPGARPLYFYVRKMHLDVVPGFREFLADLSKKPWALTVTSSSGLPLSDEDFEARSKPSTISKS